MEQGSDRRECDAWREVRGPVDPGSTLKSPTRRGFQQLPDLSP